MNKFLLFLLLVPCLLTAQPSPQERPKLVLGIVIDGFQQKHVEQLWNYLDQNGFKRVFEQGTVCSNVNFTTLPSGNCSDLATLMTGSIPKYHGITGDHYFNRSTNELESMIQDENQVGIGTHRKVSAHYLLSSSIADELVLASGGKSKSYAVAFNAEEALMLGGHTAKSVMWIDDEEMKWVASGYYTDGLSRWADEMNVNGSFKSKVTAPWIPLYSINTYLNPAIREDKKNGFLYDPMAKKGKNLLFPSILKNTPVANSLVAELGTKIFAEEQLGTDKYPDMLMLQFTVKTPSDKTNALQSAEKEDMYYRLDKDIQSLLLKIDVKIGLDKVLVVLFGTPTAVHTPSELGDNKIPAGYFNANRSMALLSTYLMAIYGQERWIDGYCGKNIYLNRKKIEEKKISLIDMQHNIADFLLDFEGIQTAFTYNQVLTSGESGNRELSRVQQSANKRSTGDVVFTLLPGWVEIDDRNNIVGEANTFQNTIPVCFYGWKMPAQQIKSFYQAIDIAPTISKVMGVPFPNACVGKPIQEINY